jgi:glycosyltransferase involved in cell wall biosynthesis
VQPAGIIRAMRLASGGAGSDQDRERRLQLLSVVAPVYNEEATIAEFHRRVASTLAGLPFELVLVDDGSSDGSGQILTRLAGEDPRVRVVSLSRNFGHQAALTAGLDHARGDAVVMLDSDLQDPPEVIPELLGRWREGADVVYAVRRERPGETRAKLATAGWFYRLFSRLAQIDLTPNAGDFRLLDRRALEALSSLRERNRFLRGMTVWVGFNQTAVAYDRGQRHAGETKYTPRRMLRFSLDAISSFSNVPLQLATVLGFIFSAIAFLGIPVAIGFRIAGQFVPGITTVLLVVLLLGGIQLITVGIIGEYLGRVYEEVKGRPLYLVRERLNIAPGDAPTAVAESPRPRAESGEEDAALQGERAARS